MRADSFGFFWNDKPPEKVRGAKREPAVRTIPPTPDTGWVVPRELPRLEKAKVIGLDTETKDLELIEKGPGVRRGAHIVGISVSTEDGKAWYLPMRHEIDGQDNLVPENVIAWAKDNLTRPNQPKIGTNLLYDLDFLAGEGVEVAGPFWDVQIAEALLDEEADGFSLDAIALRHLGIAKTKDELYHWVTGAYGTRENYRANIWRAPPKLVGPYAEADAKLPIEILRKQLTRLKAEGLKEVWDVECRLVPVLLAMRRRGVRIDMKRVAKLEGQLLKQIEEDAAKLKALVGFDVNVDMKDDLVKMFDKLGLSYPRTAPTKRHPNGQPSFVKEFLEMHQHPAAQLISSIRRWQKFLGTFVKGYLYNLNINGQIHCLFNQTRSDEFGTVSGRLSSSLPNLQNIPIRDPIWGPRMRGVFIPDRGHRRWGRLDWSQIEYRLLVNSAYRTLRGGYGSAEAVARYREDPTTDYHRYVAEITSVPRDQAKNINFGFVYGMGVEELARQLGLTLEQAGPIFTQYHAALPFVQEKRKAATEEASSVGYITTLLGRRRRFNLWQPRFNDNGSFEIALPLDEATSKWGHRLRRAYTHKALNGEIQGSAADLMKLAMAEYWDRSDLVSVLGAPLLTVHDELDFSVPPGNIGTEALHEVKRLMESVYKLSIPIIAELTIDSDWGKTK